MRNILTPIVTSKGRDQGLLVIRFFTGAVMLTHGIQKVMNFQAMSESFPNLTGLGSSFSFILIMLAETVGSVMLMLGLFTRLAALALAIGMAVAAFVAHAPFTINGSELPLLYLIVYLGLFISGAGRFSLDSAIGKKVVVSKTK